MNDSKQQIAIIGGGITGLTAAYYLQKEIREKKLPLHCMLIEASHRLGGKIQTVEKDGFIIERGPDSFLARKISARNLAVEVGMEDKLIRNATGQSFVLVNHKLYPIPEGSMMGIPTQLRPFMTTGLFSIFGKLRAAFDFFLPKSKVEGDQSLGSFFRRRLGDEVLENLIEPLLSGIYASDIDQLSLMATFPQFYEIEQKYGSLIRGMLKTRSSATSKQSGKNEGQFYTFTTGLQSFVEAIESKLMDGTVFKGNKVEKIVKNGEKYELLLNSGEKFIVDQIILTVPHSVVPKLFPEYSFFSPFKSIPLTSVATVALAFSKDDVNYEEVGTGFVVSRRSMYSITACTWTHKKWPHTTPEGKVLLRCYVGRPGDEEIVDLDDGDIVRMVLDDLRQIMNIQANPEFSIVTRWKDSMPQYTVGHKDRLLMIENEMQKHLPNVYLAGSSYYGLGIPDCIRQGEEVVKEIVQSLK